MTKPYTYRDLVQAWTCPRAWTWHRQGYESYVLPDAVLRGSMVHGGVSSYWTGSNVKDGVRTVAADYLVGLQEMRYEKEIKLQKMIAEAIDLSNRYVNLYAHTITPILQDNLLPHVEHRILTKYREWDIGGTPDCVGRRAGKLLLVELKTSNDPDISALDIAGQPDFYAYLWTLLHDSPPDLICFGIISPDYITEITRPPNLVQGKYMYERLSKFAAEWNTALRLPQYGWWCGKCPFQDPCRALDKGADPYEILASRYSMSGE